MEFGTCILALFWIMATRMGDTHYVCGNFSSLACELRPTNCAEREREYGVSLRLSCVFFLSPV